MRKLLLVDPTKCTGCEMCVDICSSHKSGAYSFERSRIRIHKDESSAYFMPLLCEHCREHPCVDICPVDAIQFDSALSIYRVDEDTCTGCGECQEICPYKGIFVSDGIAVKCDLCEAAPACVEVCYPKALQWVETTEKGIVSDLKNKLAKVNWIRSRKNE